MKPATLRRVAATAVAGIALATFSTSFHALTRLADDSGATAGWLAPMLPVAIDGMIVAASMAVVTARRAGARAGYSWALVALYTTLSVAGNAIQAAPRGPLAAAIAAAFPLTLLLSFEQLLRIATADLPDDRVSGPETAVTTVRDRVERLWIEHVRAGGDPAALTGPTVAGLAGCSVRRAQELLAELRGPIVDGAAGNGHRQVAG